MGEIDSHSRKLGELRVYERYLWLLGQRVGQNEKLLGSIIDINIMVSKMTAGRSLARHAILIMQ